jgi:hypothetical protein
MNRTSGATRRSKNSEEISLDIDGLNEAAPARIWITAIPAETEASGRACGFAFMHLRVLALYAWRIINPPTSSGF